MSESTHAFKQLVEDTGVSYEERCRETHAEGIRSKGLLEAAVADMPRETLERIYSSHEAELAHVREGTAASQALGSTRAALDLTATAQSGIDPLDEDYDVDANVGRRTDLEEEPIAAQLAQVDVEQYVPPESKPGVRSFFATGSGEGISAGARSEFGELQARMYWAIVKK